MIGDRVLELAPGTEASEPWVSHPEFLARSPEARAVLYGALDDNDVAHLVWAGREDEVPTSVQAALERFRPILASRAEIARNDKRRWFETAWPRDREKLLAPKVFALYRTDRGRFALDEEGEWQPSNKLTIVSLRDAGERAAAPVAYLCGLLNSELLDLWYAVRGKTPWHVRRNYEPKRMNEMPYRRPEGDPRADEVADRVRLLAANRRAILPYRAQVEDLGRIVKDPWRSGPVTVRGAELIAALPPTQTISVRLDAALSLQGDPDAIGRVRRAGPASITVSRGRAVLATVSGPAARLDLLELAVRGETAIAATLLPTDVAAFAFECVQIASDVRNLLAEGRRLVEEVERLVCDLYGLPAELTERVVEHAVRRAGDLLTADYEE